MLKLRVRHSTNEFPVVLLTCPHCKKLKAKANINRGFSWTADRCTSCHTQIPDGPSMLNSNTYTILWYTGRSPETDVFANKKI